MNKEWVIVPIVSRPPVTITRTALYRFDHIAGQRSSEYLACAIDFYPVKETAVSPCYLYPN